MVLIVDVDGRGGLNAEDGGDANVHTVWKSKNPLCTFVYTISAISTVVYAHVMLMMVGQTGVCTG